MAEVIVTIKIMPESPEINLEDIKVKATEVISAAQGEVGKSEEVPMAFGLKALNLVFVRDESLGSVDEIESNITEIDGVNSAETIDVRRAIG